jgi:Flp pilus assembly protein TadG
MSPISRLADRRGMAAVEFALLVPFMLLLLLGVADLVTWMRSWLQVTRAASEVGQIIGQYIALHEADFTGTFYPVAQSIAGSVAVQCDPKNVTNGNVVISGITTSSGKPTVSWQRNWGTCITSHIGQQGKSATLPTGYIPPNGAAVIVVEVWATQPAFVLSKAPGFMNGSGSSAIRSYAIVTTRNGVLPAVQQ